MWNCVLNSTDSVIVSVIKRTISYLYTFFYNFVEPGDGTFWPKHVACSERDIVVQKLTVLFDSVLLVSGLYKTQWDIILKKNYLTTPRHKMKKKSRFASPWRSHTLCVTVHDWIEPDGQYSWTHNLMANTFEHACEVSYRLTAWMSWFPDQLINKHPYTLEKVKVGRSHIVFAFNC